MHFLNLRAGTDDGAVRHPSMSGAPGERRSAHRHVLALPLFLGMLLVTAVGAVGAPRAQVLDQPPMASGTIAAEGADRIFSLARGAVGVLREDGMLHDDGREFALEEGVLLTASPVQSDVRIGNILLRGFHGGFLVARARGRLTVHALTTPVLLAHDGFRFVVPAGMQGGFTESDLPSVADLAGAMQLQSALTVIPESIADDERREIAALPQSPSLTATPMTMSELQTVLRSGDRMAAHNLLRSTEVQTLLSATDLPGDLLPTLLADAAAVPSAAQELLQFLQDSDLWLLLSFHPDYRGAAWGASIPPAVPAATRELRLLLLPSSDVGGVAFPDHILDRWRVETAEELASTEHPEEFLARLLATLEPFRTFAEANSYPERLQRTAQALQQIAGPSVDRLPRDAREQLAAWGEIDAIAVAIVHDPLPPSVTDALSSSSASSSAVSSEPFDAAAVEANAKQLLLDAGALFTTQTVLRADDGAHVTVQNLLFAAPDGEHSYEFTLDLRGSACTAIRKDGQALPYPFPLDALSQWARGE